MKAAIFFGPHDIEIEEVEIPGITDDQVLVKVEACGICGSDLHMFKLGLFTKGLCRSLEQGGIPGHEYSGEVIEVGSRVEGFKVGDRVAGSDLGSMAEYVPATIIPNLNPLKLRPEVGFEEAATLEPLANSLHATLKGRPVAGENVIVFGAGVIGLGVVQCLRALDIGLNKIIMVDVADSRLNAAKQLGADGVINASRENLIDKAVEIIGSASILSSQTKPRAMIDVVYDCVGYIEERPEPPVIQQAINIIRDITGRVVVHGIFENNVNLNLMPLVIKQVSVFGSYAYTPESALQALELIQTKKIDRLGLISHRYQLDQVKEAFNTACDTNESLKVIIKP